MSESSVASDPHLEAPSPAADASHDAAQDAPELSLREIIEKASRGELVEQEAAPDDKPVIERDENGRFTAKNAATGDTAEEVATDKPETTAQEPESPAIPAPQSLSEPEKAIFASLPREAQEIIVRRERDAERALQERAPQIRDYQAIQEVLAPHAQNWRVQGYTDVDAIRMWATVAGELRRDPANAIRELAKSHGLAPEQILGQQADPNQPQASVQPDIMRELAEVKRELAAFKQQGEQAQASTVAQNIERFAADPRHPHFEAVRVHMGALMQAGVAKDMEDAYEQAVYANREVRAKIEAEKNAAAEAAKLAEAKKKAEAARRAPTPVRGIPPVSNGVIAQGGDGSVRADIMAAIDALR